MLLVFPPKHKEKKEKLLKEALSSFFLLVEDLLRGPLTPNYPQAGRGNRQTDTQANVRRANIKPRPQNSQIFFVRNIIDRFFGVGLVYFTSYKSGFCC